MGIADRSSGPVIGRNGADRGATKVYLVGGGIASLAAAAFMIRDGDVPGHNITILEELDRLGGGLDGAGSATSCSHRSLRSTGVGRSRRRFSTGTRR
jgi:myosin-crossreactive antigen